MVKIHEYWKKILEEWGIKKEQIACIVTDSASNMKGTAGKLDHTLKQI